MSGKRNWGDNMTHRMDGKTPPPMDASLPKVPSRSWRKKYACKANKGDHTPEILKIQWGGWHLDQDGTWRQPSWHSYFSVTWQCTACHKRMLEWRPPEKKFDKYRKTIWEHAA